MKKKNNFELTLLLYHEEILVNPFVFKHNATISAERSLFSLTNLQNIMWFAL